MRNLSKAIWFWAFNVLVATSQFGNTLLGPVLNLIFRTRLFGDPDESISGVLGKLHPHCTACRRICRLLSVLDPREGDHCINSIEIDESPK